MRVAENDKVISGMLHDELKRCEEMRERLLKSVSKLPKGVIQKSKKRYKDKEYTYLCLKYREGKKVINKHIPKKNIKEISGKIELREKYEKEINSYSRKIAYLHQILKSRKGKKLGKGYQK